jgi:hypothetical protein
MLFKAAIVLPAMWLLGRVGVYRLSDLAQARGPRTDGSHSSQASPLRLRQLAAAARGDDRGSGVGH